MQILKLSAQNLYYSESEVLQYFGNMKHNSAALDAFAEVMKVYYQQWTVRCKALNGLEHDLVIHGFRST